MTKQNLKLNTNSYKLKTKSSNSWVIRYTLYVTRSRGQALIELLIALALLSLTFAATTQVFIDVSYGDLVNMQRVRAEGLAQEGIEALKNIGERSWSELTNVSFPVHPVITDGRWESVEGVETIDILTRQITMENVERDSYGQIISSGGTIDPSTKKFIVTVSWNNPRSLQIQKEIYLSRWRGNSTYTENLVAHYINGTLLDTEITNEAGGEIRLDVGEGFGGFKGNRFSTLTNDSVGNLDHEDKMMSFRFTAQYTGDVDYIRIYVNDGHPIQPPKYRFGLQSDLNGKPSGVWLGENHDAYKDYRIKTLGWKELELEHDAQIVAGTPYHLVVQYHSEQINPAKYIDLRALYPLNKIVPFDGSADEYRMTLWSEDAGATWTDIDKSPVFILIPEEDGEVDYDHSEGNPYYNAYDAQIYETNYKGQIFTYSDETESFSKLGTYVYIKSDNPAPQDNLYFQITDLDTGEDLIPEDDRIFITPEQVSVDYQLKEKIFANPLTLTQGHRYRLYFYSPGTFPHSHAYQVGTGENTDQSPDNDINYLAGDSIYTESGNSGTNWADFLNRDIFYQFSVVAEAGYFTTGTYISQTFDAGSAVAFNRVFWTSEIPDGTELKFHIATNTDNSTWDFVGPDGSASTYFAPDSTGAINLLNVEGRYFKYKAYFATADGEITPVLDNFSVNYSL